MIVLFGRDKEVVEEYAKKIITVFPKEDTSCFDIIPYEYKDVVTVFGRDKDGNLIVSSEVEGFLTYLINSDIKFKYRQVLNINCVRDMSDSQVRTLYGYL